MISTTCQASLLSLRCLQRPTPRLAQQACWHLSSTQVCGLTALGHYLLTDPPLGSTSSPPITTALAGMVRLLAARRQCLIPPLLRASLFSRHRLWHPAGRRQQPTAPSSTSRPYTRSFLEPEVGPVGLPADTTPSPRKRPALWRIAYRLASGYGMLPRS